MQGQGRACLGPVTALPLSPLPGFLDWVPKKMQRVGCDAGKLAEVYAKKQETERRLQEQMTRWEELSLQLEE